MKGLLLKDAYMAWKYCRAFLLIVVIFAMTLVLDTTNFFYIAYPAIFYGMIPVQTLFYDEKFKWPVYSATLPLTRHQIVSSKYLLTLIIAGLMTSVTLVFRLLYAMFRFIYSLCTIGLPPMITSSFFKERFLNHLFTDTFPMLLILPIIILLFSMSLELPILFKMGTEKGRMFYQILNGFFCGAIVCLQFADNAVIRTMLSKTYASPEELANTPTMFSNGVLLLLLWVSLAVFALSWYLSVRFYQKREL